MFSSFGIGRFWLVCQSNLLLDLAFSFLQLGRNLPGAIYQGKKVAYIDLDLVLRVGYHAAAVGFNFIKTVPPKAAVAAAVAPLLKGDVAHPDDDIPLQPVSGREAVLLAAHSYRDLHIHPDYCQQTARRTIGVLWYSPAQNALLDEVPLIVERINAAKSNIQRYITQTFPTRGERFEALRDSCPGVMTMHLYRHIRCISSGEVRAIRFSWLRKDRLQQACFVLQVRHPVSGCLVVSVDHHHFVHREAAPQTLHIPALHQDNDLALWLGVLQRIVLGINPELAKGVERDNICVLGGTASLRSFHEQLTLQGRARSHSLGARGTHQLANRAGSSPEVHRTAQSCINPRR